MRNITLYNEIKALVLESFEAESNATAWKKISKEKMAEARMLTATAKKMTANKGKEFTFQALVDYIVDNQEYAPVSDADTDLTDYRPGDFPASENTEEVESGQPDSSPANEEEPHESENL